MGLALCAFGVICVFAVHGHVGFLDTWVAGLVLLATGLAWLLIPVRGKKDWLCRLFAATMTQVSWDPAQPHETSCSLEDLLDPAEQHNSPA